MGDALAAEDPETQFRSLVGNIPGVVYRSECRDPWRMYFISDYVETMLGFPAAEFVGNATRTFGSILHPEDIETMGVVMADVLDHRTSYSIEYRLAHASGTTVWVSEHGRVVRDADGAPLWLDGVMLDISRQKIAESERDSAEQRLRYQALHDGLTGLPNRVSFLADADAAIRDVLANGSRLELVIMDLDHFKEVNDTLGHANGDILLQEVAVRIADALGPGDFCARLGGDEFAIVIRDASPEASGNLLAEISESLESTIELEGFPVNIEASLGIARLPEDGTSLEELMRRADWAMYQSKHGRSMIASGNVSGSASRELSDDFRRAVAGGGLTLHYQPKLDLHTLRLDGVEALVRWPHPERGLIYPEELIPLAERANLVRPLTLFVIGEALRQCRAWLDHGREVPVSVNLWMRNLIDAALPARIRELLDHHGVPARMLKLEMSETAFVSDPLRIAAVLEQLGDLGVQFSVARFGAGYSSLSSLHRLPITEVKIDRGLIAGLQAGEADESVLRAAIGLGRDLGFRVVAEGVETDEMVTRLGALGSDSVQGFVVSVPLPPGELEAWLDERFGGSGPRVVV